MSQYESLIDTNKGRYQNLSKTVVFVFLGIYSVCYSAYLIYRHEAVTKIITALTIGLFVLFASNFSKRFFIAKEGIVEEINSWSGRKHTLMPWQDLLLVAFVTEFEKLTVYFDNGTKVYKLEFGSWQRRDIKQVIKRYAAHIDINEIIK